MSIDSHNIIADALQGTLEAHPSWKLNQQVYEFMLQDLPAYYSLAGDDLPDNVQFVVNAGTGGGEIIVSAISIEFICDELTAFLDTLEHIQSVSFHYGEITLDKELVPIVGCRFIYKDLFLF